MNTNSSVGEDIIQLFLSFSLNTRHLTPDTVKSYHVDLLQLCFYLAGDIRCAVNQGRGKGKEQCIQPQNSNQLLLGASDSDFKKYHTFLNEQAYSPATLRRKLSALRTFYKYCLKRGLVTVNFPKGLPSPKSNRRIPRTLEANDIVRLLQAPDHTTLLGARDRAMLEVLVGTGVRTSELINLNIPAVDFSKSEILVQRKGRKARPQTISEICRTALQQYLEFRQVDKQAMSVGSTALFINKHGQRLSNRGVRRKLDKYLAQCGLDPTISPQTLRHSYATQLLSKGVDMRTLQQCLGHSTHGTTHLVYSLVASANGPALRIDSG